MPNFGGKRGTVGDSSDLLKAVKLQTIRNANQPEYSKNRVITSTHAGISPIQVVQYNAVSQQLTNVLSRPPLGGTSSRWAIVNVPINYCVGLAISDNGLYQVAAMGGAGPVYYSSNGGDTWALYTITDNWTAVAMSSSGQYQTLIGEGGSDTQVYVSSNYGVTWNSFVLGSGGWYDVGMSSDGRYQIATQFTIGSIHKVYTSSNYGIDGSWNELTTTFIPITARVSLGGTRITIGSTNGRYYVSSDSGTTWTLHTIPTQTTSVQVSMSANGLYQIVATAYSRLYRSSDSGTTWNVIPSLPSGEASVSWRKFQMSSDGKNHIAGLSNGKVYTSSDYGVTWSLETDLVIPTCTDVAVSLNGTYSLVGTENNGIYRKV